MSEYDEGLQRTEQPTERRRDEAREQGQFAFSQELANSLVLLAGALSALSPAQEQDFPSKPIRIIVAFPPSGFVDIGTRIVAPHLSAAK